MQLLNHQELNKRWDVYSNKYGKLLLLNCQNINLPDGVVPLPTGDT